MRQGMPWCARAGFAWRLATGGAMLAGVPSAGAQTLYAYDNLAEARGGVGDALICFEATDPAAVTELGRSGVAHTAMVGLEFTPDGRLWSYGVPLDAIGQTGLFSVDLQTGAATWVGAGGIEGGRLITDLAYNPADGLMYGPAHLLGQQPQLYTLELDTGQATLVGALTSVNPIVPYGLGADLTGTLFVMGPVTNTNGDGLFRIDGLQLVPVIDLPIELLFSQGIAIDWSGAFGEVNAGYHGAYNAANFHCQLWAFDVAGASAEYLGDIGPLNSHGTSVHETGDVAIRPRGASRLLAPPPIRIR